MVAKSLRILAASLRAQAEAFEALADAAESSPDDAQAPTAPALLDRQALARALGVSLGTLDRLRREGLPTVRVCDSPRFLLSDVVDWLRCRHQDPPLRVVGGRER